MENTKSQSAGGFQKILLGANTLMLIYLIWKSIGCCTCCDKTDQTPASSIREGTRQDSSIVIQESAPEPLAKQPIVESNPVAENSAAPNSSEEEDLWKTAQDKKTAYSFGRYLKLFPNGKHSKEAEKALIDIEVRDLISKHPGKLPPMDAKTPPGGKSKIHSIVEVKNDTRHELVVRYSGPESAKVILKAGEVKRLTLANGGYDITATVQGANIKTYAAHDKLDGMMYYSEFYTP